MNTNKARLLITILAMIFTVSSFFIYKLSNATNNNSELRNAIMNLRLLNKEIDMYFKKSLVSVNYDDINSIFTEFNNNLKSLKEINSFSVLAEIYGNENDILTIQNIYDKKRQLLDRFNYINSGAIAFLIDSEYMIKRSEDLKPLENLLLRLKNNDFTDIHSINSVEQDIQNLSLRVYNEENTSYFEVLKKANFILNSLSNLREIYQQNTILNLSNYLDNILIAYDHQYSRIMDFLYMFMVVAFLMFLSVLVFVFAQGVSYKNKTKELGMLKLAVDDGYDSIMFTDENNKIFYTNKAFEKNSGYSLEELYGKDPNILKSSLHSNSFYENLKNTIYDKKIWTSDELVSKTKSGSYIYEKVKFLPFIFENKMSGFVGVKMDRTKEAKMVRELELKNEQLKAQSIIDRLTGFGNYFAMIERLEEKKDGMVVNINIKNFDNLRFFYQTKIVDAMILAFANTLRLCVETLDMKAELFRFQDDEFYLWYNGDDILQDIGYIQDYFSFSAIDIQVDDKMENIPGLKAIIGVSLPDDTVQTNRLMQAILANQQAHKLGSDTYYYKENDAIELRYYKNQVTTQLIEYALENNTVIVECQGIFDVNKPDEKATYYEVLVRLIDQNGKIRYPGEFLEVAMQTQLYTQITKKIIAQAFLLVERYPKYTFSINLSSIDIVDSMVREFLEEKLQLCSDPSRVCFEILESEEVSDYTMVNSFIKHIKSYGAKISIDDFGSGYSNYYRILELDIDNIKIDGSIIKKLPFDQNAQYLVETIINFASKQGYKVIAEFVSTPEILEQLKRFKIQFAQGFLLGKPQPSDLL